jgi:CRISPR/Cas system CMR subunit Cmr6 (Cas7 group RAMP superfamily)
MPNIKLLGISDQLLISIREKAAELGYTHKVTRNDLTDEDRISLFYEIWTDSDEFDDEIRKRLEKVEDEEEEFDRERSKLIKISEVLCYLYIHPPTPYVLECFKIFEEIFEQTQFGKKVRKREITLRVIEALKKIGEEYVKVISEKVFLNEKPKEVITDNLELFSRKMLSFEENAENPYPLEWRKEFAKASNKFSQKLTQMHDIPVIVGLLRSSKFENSLSFGEKFGLPIVVAPFIEGILPTTTTHTEEDIKLEEIEDEDLDLLKPSLKERFERLTFSELNDYDEEGDIKQDKSDEESDNPMEEERPPTVRSLTPPLASQSSAPPQEEESSDSSGPPIGTGRWNRRNYRRRSTPEKPKAKQAVNTFDQQGGQRDGSPVSDQDDLEEHFLDDLHDRSEDFINKHNNYEKLPEIHDHHQRFATSTDEPQTLHKYDVQDDDFVVALNDSHRSIRFVLTIVERTRKPVFNRIIDERRNRYS